MLSESLPGTDFYDSSQVHIVRDGSRTRCRIRVNDMLAYVASPTLCIFFAIFGDQLSTGPDIQTGADHIPRR